MTDQEQQQLTAAGNEMSASFLAAKKRSDATLAKLEAEPGKFTMLTGDRPTGRLHLGHYFGSIKERVAMQNRGVNTNIIIADYQVITDRAKLFGSGIEIANKIRSAVSAELGITISVGVSFNKVFAKLASDLKKPDAVTCIEKKLFKKIVWPLPVSDLIGVGRRTAKTLNSLYIKTIGDLAKEPPEHLQKILGKCGLLLWKYANGLENSPVTDCDFSSPVKSIGHGITTPSNLKHNNEVWHVIFALSETIGKKLRSNRLAASGIQISVRDSEFKTHEFQCMLPAPTQSSLAVSRQAFCLFSKKYAWTHDIRSVSVRAINLVPYGTPYQLDLWGDAFKMNKVEKIEDTMDKLQERFGSKIINYAMILYDTRHYSFCENSFH